MAVPQVTVIIPTVGRRRTLLSCVEALLALPDSTTFDVLVVDNGGGRARALLDSAGLSDRCAVVDEPERGLNRARNAGIRAATTGLVWFVDDDEIVRAGVLDALAAALAGDVRASAAGGPYRTKALGARPRGVCPSCWLRIKSLRDDELGDGEAAVETAELLGGNVLIRREAFDRFGMFHEALSGPGDETEWFSRARAAGATFLLVGEAWVWHLADPADVTPLGMLRRAPWAGRSWARSLALRGERPCRRDAETVARFLAHGVRVGCWYAPALAVDRAIGALSAPSERRRLAPS